MMRVGFLRPAELEVDEAIAYFDQQREGLGDRFERDLVTTVKFVAEHPFSGKSISDQVRKFRLSSFPYNVIYVLSEHEILIIAVAHHRRRPGYWRDRLTSLR